ncbi:MAG: hypothetical protein R3230_02550 [Nitrosopumilaceae archaeon]|nr:hypothetical protein [Nitrosopumilaceae archaeon]
MRNHLIIFGLVFFVFLAIPAISDASAHSLFNSAEEFIGGFRVQIATLPEFPQIGEKSQILIRVTDADYEEVNRFMMGMRFTYHGDQIQAFTPQSIEGSHWETDFVFEESGNHIVYVDLYDMKGQGEILTYTFNIGTQSPFGYIFFIAITIGATMFAIVVGYIYLPKRFQKFKP